MGKVIFKRWFVPGKGIYTGKYCEKNVVDGVGACSEVRQCVECQNFQHHHQQCQNCLFQTNILEVTSPQKRSH